MDRLWAGIYWGSFILGSFVIPFFQAYWTAGHFSFCSRLKFATKQMLKKTLIGLAIFVFFCILGFWLLKARFIDKFKTSVLLMSNIYGTLLLVLLLSYGMTFLPYSIWLKTNTESVLFESLAEADEIYKNYRDARVDFHTEVSICRNLVKNNTTGYNK
jgi:hypothetical protein